MKGNKRTIADDNGKGFSQTAKEIRNGYLNIDVKYHSKQLSANFKKIVNTDCYVVQRKEIK